MNVPNDLNELTDDEQLRTIEEGRAWEVTASDGIRTYFGSVIADDEEEADAVAAREDCELVGRMDF
jgi:hypothetical protein